MKLNYNQILERANVILKYQVEEKYREKFPDLDVNLVRVDLGESVSAMFEALIESINESK